MPTPKIKDAVLIEMLDTLERFQGSQRLASIELGIPQSTFKSRIETAIAKGLKPSSGGNVSKAGRGQHMLPKSIPLGEESYHISGERSILVMSDIHVPYHDEQALEIAIEYGIKQKADTIILNGDIIDCAALSRHEKTPAQRDGLEVEISKTREFLAFIRATFPDAEILFNEGNHCHRLPAYISAHAPELWTLAQLSMPSLLHLGQYGIKWLSSMQHLTAGDLHIIHGHEYRKSGVNVARATYIDASANVLTGHHHRSQEYTHRNIDGKVFGVWTTGCLCQLSQPWLPHNQWVHGFAHIQLEDSGHFVVSNRKIIDGRIY